MNGDHICLWKRCREGDYPKYAKLLEHPDHYATAKGLTYHIEGTCRHCNRKLTVPESIETGLGPICGHRTSSQRTTAPKTKNQEGDMTIDITRVFITHDDNGGLVFDHSDVRGQLAVGHWPMRLTLVGDDEPKTFTRGESIPMGDDLGGFIYRADDGTKLTIFND